MWITKVTFIGSNGHKTITTDESVEEADAKKIYHIELIKWLCRLTLMSPEHVMFNNIGGRFRINLDDENNMMMSIIQLHIDCANKNNENYKVSFNIEIFKDE